MIEPYILDARPAIDRITGRDPADMLDMLTERLETEHNCEPEADYHPLSRFLVDLEDIRQVVRVQAAQAGGAS